MAVYDCITFLWRQYDDDMMATMMITNDDCTVYNVEVEVVMVVELLINR